MPNNYLPQYRVLLSGGHITPALAVIEELKSQGNWDIHFVGRAKTSEQSSSPSVESELVSGHRIPFYHLQLLKFDRTNPLAILTRPSKLFHSIVDTWNMVGTISPDVTLSFGGYIGFWISLISYLRKIPVVIHEQTTSPGLANRISSLFATKVAVSWPQTTHFPAHKTVLTGNPIRLELTRKPLKKKYPLNSTLPTIAILGGNQGSHAINQLVIPILPWLLGKANIFLQTGTLTPEDLTQAKNSLESKMFEGKIYIHKFFFPSEYPEVIMKADFIISRSGANTTTELASLGKVALLIPLPDSASGEQFTNAKLLEPYGSQILQQSSLTPSHLQSHISHFLDNLHTLKTRARLSREIVQVDSAAKIVNLLKTVLSPTPNGLR